MEIFFGKVSWNLTVFENFQCSDWLIQWSHALKWDFERFHAYLKLLEVMDPYRTLFDSLFETFLISKVSNSTSHLKSHLKVSNEQQMTLEMRCMISALHKGNWLPCYCITYEKLKLWYQWPKKILFMQSEKENWMWSNLNRYIYVVLLNAQSVMKNLIKYLTFTHLHQKCFHCAFYLNVKVVKSVLSSSTRI